MANIVTESRREVHERFLAGQIITTQSFYAQHDTAMLLRLLAGWERDFDAACGGDETRQPKEWLQDRLHLITNILEERNHTPAERMGNGVRSKLAKSVTKFNQ